MDENTYQDLTSWLKLVRAPGLTLHLAHLLLSKFSHPENILSQSKSYLKAKGLQNRTIEFLHGKNQKQIDLDIQWIDAKNNRFIHIFHTDFPDLLKQISNPPLALFVSGILDNLNKPQIAVIGSRKSTPGGKRIAYDFARELGECGITITSGLATGIDTSAHKGALSSSSGTYAVMGNGLDMVYPKSNLSLAEEIAESGLLISEFPLNTRPLPYHFPRRNRIISGLSLGVLVVEASLKSGSLITANLAAEQGREVFAIPGSILNPMAEGCNKLISNGAKLSTKIEDIIEEVPCLQNMIINYEETKRILQVDNETLDEQVKLLLDNIGYEPVSFDDIISSSGIPVKKLRILLPKLELEELIQSTPGGGYIKR